ncbi:Calx-beta domain-containing protein [Mariniphaga anaerophila]|uniref:Calx-beta domain-containing protein n=1 Tax=Mariniphaga anaerophila TaxID=1484053 RepID=A0A1M4VP68_9BACT|nr:Calx-beta domain-containing protein [Mariniphaga anaerophila]SHE70769.1 Calx-beta domain-containing protein [Mariniphaga anaerophila]
MKKITIYISVLAGIVLFFSACELNDYPKFDDAEAFVAFSSENMTVTEDAGTLEIPVRLTSLSGLSSTVSFDFIDSTAVKGRDYSLKGGASVLNFDGNEAVQNIEVDIVNHNGVFTGDMKFGVRITSSGSVNAGSIDTMWVTIADLDHPLAFILGEFTATATSYFNDKEEWTVTLDKDISDVNKVWITNLVNRGSSAKSPVYGIVNEEQTEIKIPVGQVTVLSDTYDVLLKGFYGPDGETGIEDGGAITGLIDPDGTIHIQDEFGSQAFTKGTTNSAGWYNIFQADAVLVKK